MKVVIYFMSLVLVSVTAIPLLCYRPYVYGTCKGNRRMWAYLQYENKCIPFAYSGCGGTENRFYTKEHCESVCYNRKLLE